MQALARKTGDATLLVAAARGAESFQAGDIMIAEARRMDPELPFVWWDMQRIKPPRISGITPAERLKLLRVELADIEKFRSQIGRASCRERVVSVRVDLGGRRIINKKNSKHEIRI